MTREEFEKKLVAVLAEASQAGYLHSAVIMASTRDAHLMLTNMGQKTTVRFLMHMAEHALRDDHTGMVAYNLVTGEQHEGEFAEESFQGKAPKRGRKAH